MTKLIFLYLTASQPGQGRIGGLKPEVYCPGLWQFMVETALVYGNLLLCFMAVSRIYTRSMLAL